MAKLVNEVKTVSEEQVLHINAGNPKIMVVYKADCLTVSTILVEYEKIISFMYLNGTIEAR